MTSFGKGAKLVGGGGEGGQGQSNEEGNCLYVWERGNHLAGDLSK